MWLPLLNSPAVFRLVAKNNKNISDKVIRIDSHLSIKNQTRTGRYRLANRISDTSMQESQRKATHWVTVNESLDLASIDTLV